MATFLLKNQFYSIFIAFSFSTENKQKKYFYIFKIFLAWFFPK